MLYLPASLRKQICEYYHDDPMSGHLGQTKTVARINEKYYWPKMDKYISDFVATCHLCQSKKIPKTGPVGLLQPIKVDAPFYHVGIDVLGPLPIAHGRRYILVCVDYFTKWIETRAVPSASTLATAKFLIEQVFCRHGAPSILVSDRGSNFISHVVQEINKLLSTKAATTTAYHPQANGLVERINGIIANMMSMYVNKYHSDWDRYLPFITFAYNSAKQDSTKMSPFFLLNAREPMTAQDVNSGIELEAHASRSEYAEVLKTHWPKVQQMAKQAIEGAQRRYTANYNRKRKEVDFPIGSLVLVRTPIPQPGLAKKF